MDEVMDYYTIAQVTPGVIAVNVSTFIGCKRNGTLGGAIATIAFVLPGVAFVALIALCVASFADYPATRHALAGIRVAVGAIILDMVAKLSKGVFSALFSAAKPDTG
jgi:chromate transporter